MEAKACSGLSSLIENTSSSTATAADGDIRRCSGVSRLGCYSDCPGHVRPENDTGSAVLGGGGQWRHRNIFLPIRPYPEIHRNAADWPPLTVRHRGNQFPVLILQGP